MFHQEACDASDAMTTTTLLTPARVARLLKIGKTFTYHKLKMAESGCVAVSAKTVVDWLNSCRTNATMPELDEPIPLLTEADVAPLVTVNGRPATPEQMRRFARRKLFPIPAFALSPKVVRFPFGAVQWWLSFLDSPVSVRFRRYAYGAAPRESASITHPQRRNLGVRAASRA